MTWVLVIWTLVMAIWAIAGASAVSDQAGKCATDSSVTSGILTKQQCIDATNAGGGIGIGLIFVLWVFGVIALGIIWLITRPRHRTCPVCGDDVKKGLTACNSCGHDFAAALRPATTNG